MGTTGVEQFLTILLSPVFEGGIDKTTDANTCRWTPATSYLIEKRL